MSSIFTISTVLDFQITKFDIKVNFIGRGGVKFLSTGKLLDRCSLSPFELGKKIF